MLLCMAGTCLAGHGVFTKPASDGGWLALLGGGQHRIDAHFFRSAEAGLCIIDEGDGQPVYGTLEEAMRREKCRAGVNGGYFGADAARTPLGLVKHAGRMISPLATSGFTVVGIVYDTGTTLRMERTSRLSTPVAAMREAIQGGPFLVDQGRVVPGLEKTKRAARTFIATDGAGNWCVAVSSPLTLRELAEWLVQKDCLGSFRVQMALNLDGGSSCAFWDGAAGVHLPGFKAVRNYVGVLPRAVSARGGSSGGSKSPAK